MKTKLMSTQRTQSGSVLVADETNYWLNMLKQEQLKPLHFHHVRNGQLFCARTFNGMLEYFVFKYNDMTHWKVSSRLYFADNKHDTYEDAVKFANQVHLDLLNGELA